MVGGPSWEAPGQSGLAAFGIAVAAVVCCAALPLLAALAGGVAIGAVLGVGGGILAAVVIVAAIVVRTRRSSAASSLPRRAETAPPTDAPGERSKMTARRRWVVADAAVIPAAPAGEAPVQAEDHEPKGEP